MDRDERILAFVEELKQLAREYDVVLDINSYGYIDMFVVSLNDPPGYTHEQLDKNWDIWDDNLDLLAQETIEKYNQFEGRNL